MSSNMAWNEYILVAKSMGQATVLWGLGDIVAQGIGHHHNAKMRRAEEAALREARGEEQPAPSAKKKGMPPLSVMLGGWDHMQTARASFFGGFFFAPLAHRWYGALNSVFPPPAKGGVPAQTILKRVASDQFIWSPCILTLYFAYNAVMNDGLNFVESAFYKVSTALLPTLLTNWCVWIPLQWFNFMFVNPARWFLLVNVAAVPWTAYMAYTNAKTDEKLQLERIEKQKLAEKEEEMKNYVQEALAKDKRKKILR